MRLDWTNPMLNYKIKKKQKKKKAHLNNALWASQLVFVNLTINKGFFLLFL